MNEGAQSKPSSRQNKRVLTTHLDAELYENFRKLTERAGTTNELMITKAITLLLEEADVRVPLAIRRKVAVLDL